MTKAKAEKQRVTTPVGRLINNSLFEKDAYTDEKGREATPSYKIEMAFDEKDIVELENAIVAAAVAEWGKDAEKDYDKGEIRSPIIDGNELAKKREAKGKKGDAYAGKLVIRAATIYNRNGDDAPGGVYVCGPDAVEIDFANRGEIYNGVLGVAVVVPSAYSVSGERGVTLYLQGFQKVEDGERLRGQDVSSLFKPMMGKGSETKGRRSRG